jgi:hypothetical protein
MGKNNEWKSNMNNQLNSNDVANGKQKKLALREKLHTKFAINPVISCRVEETDGIILYNPDIDDFALINSSGLLIWNFLKEPHSILEIVKHISQTCNNSPSEEKINDDITLFLTHLIPEYIIEVVSDEP